MVKNIVEPISLGVDLGGTKVNVALVDSVGQLVFSHKSLIDSSKQPDKVIQNMLESANLLLDKTGYEANAFGVGIAAQIDRDGFIFGSPNLGWKNFSLKQKLQEHLDLPVFITNDVRAATWAEWRFGAGKGVDDLVVLFVGTGIGGGVITEGQLLSGCNNSGAELGHVTLVYDGRKCRCPNSGCLEAYAGGWAIAERAQKAVAEDSEAGSLLLSLAGAVENITSATVSQAYYKQDQLAIRLVEETGKYLAAGAISVVNAFNPCCLVLGGGVIEGIPELVEIVENELPTRALKSAVTKLKIVKAKLGNNAGAIGAADLAQKVIS